LHFLEAGKSKKKIVAKFLLMSKLFVNISTISSGFDSSKNVRVLTVMAGGRKSSALIEV
jgi:hypothetical protein